MLAQHVRGPLCLIVAYDGRVHYTLSWYVPVPPGANKMVQRGNDFVLGAVVGEENQLLKGAPAKSEATIQPTTLDGLGLVVLLASWSGRALNCMPDSSIESQGTYPMLRIETELDGPQMVLRLIGRIRDDSLEELRQHVQGRTTLIILDLAEVTLVDLPSVRFLRDCQDQKIELRNCAPYILEWIRRERVEGQK